VSPRKRKAIKMQKHNGSKYKKKGNINASSNEKKEIDDLNPKARSNPKKPDPEGRGQNRT